MCALIFEFGLVSVLVACLIPHKLTWRYPGQLLVLQHSLVGVVLPFLHMKSGMMTVHVL